MKEDSIVEQRIKAAAAAGAFDNLPGAGAPLPPDDAEAVPAELRVAYRLLKNAGFAPPEVAHRRSIAALEQAVAQHGGLDDKARARAIAKLGLLRAQCERRGGESHLSVALGDYRERLLGKLS